AGLTAAGVQSTATVLGPDAATTAPDLVVHCAAPGDRATLLAATRDAGEVPIVPLVLGSGTAVLGPLTGRAGGPCWVCAQLRLAATGDPAAAADLWRELALGVPVRPRLAMGGATLGSLVSPSAVVAGMLGTAAAFEAFRLLAGLPADVAGAAVVQDLDTLESSRHRVFRHPLCPCCTESANEAPALEPAADDEERYERLTVLVDDRLGVFGRFTDDGMTQAPLKVAGIAVGSPSGLVHGRRELVAFDETSVLRARNTAIGLAVLDYVGQAPDAADIVHGTAAALATDVTVLPPSRLTTATGVPGEVTEWVAATSLCNGERVLVPLAAAFPTSAANADRVVEPAPVGAAIGDTVDQLAETALTAALAHRALRDAVEGTSPPRPVDEADQPAALRDGLAHFGHTATVYDLPGAAPAHAALAVLTTSGEAPLWTIGHGLDRAGATSAALRDLLGLVQLRADGATGEPGDLPLPGFDPRALRVGAAAEPARAATSRADLVAALGAAGWDALLVETTTPDVRAAAALVSGVVLLAAPDGGGDEPASGGRAEGTRTEQGG
ncbi:MAG TPA: TOMM precursor leader peptide-binding protein, partial [Actinophytocola sp.]|nr:TOMM precursor leader peptide-binding protein [Actinophytocola sp.]